ncbi:branched-chain amino acid aminotransferase [Methylocystis bryophila]|uniref:Probable branched-chain-amino-acid aminotransferase n=1 Tax=Methylocystis bryophila TaxID=655015 RepID=A0A1W6MUK3_9HYPH|nr:branched-chain amino acid aminotransferase [Methylocystis bryophila]ARN81247.1 branched chain amino acid aminotransferase [Methylocystis bryophila]BDV37200.1 aminotransferase [Methylocystis bryophila]
MNAVNTTPSAPTRTWSFFEGAWREGNQPILGVRSHGAWLGSVVFDGARAFEGVTPDLDKHLARVNWSAANMSLDPVVTLERWRELVAEGLSRFAPDAQLYIRPMYWAEQGYGGGVRFDPASTNWCLSIYEAPMPAPRGGAVTLSPFRRPTLEMAPVNAKASCHYANGARALIEAAGRGFDNCLMLDALGNVAEFANSNAFMAKDGVVFTPAPNGTFLDGVTRQRVIGLLRAAGVTVVETLLSYRDFATADEIFSTGNFQKVAPMTRIDERALQAGPLYQTARALYWRFAHDPESAPR